MSFVPNFIKNLFTGTTGECQQNVRIIPEDVQKRVNYSETLMKLSNNPYIYKQKVRDDIVKLYLDFPQVDNSKISLLLKGYDDLNPEYEILLAEFPKQFQLEKMRKKELQQQNYSLISTTQTLPLYQGQKMSKVFLNEILLKLDNQVRVNTYYLQYVQNDIYLDKLIKSIGTWNEHKDITKIFSELLALISDQFPFYSCKDVEVVQFLQPTNVYLPWNDEEYQKNNDGQAEEMIQQVQIPAQALIKNKSITNPPLVGNSPIIDINTGLDLTFLKTFEKTVKDKISIGCQGLVNDIKQQKKKLTSTLNVMDQQSRVFQEQGFLIQELDITIPEIINADMTNEQVIHENQQKLQGLEDMDKYFDFVPAQTMDVYTEIRASMDTIQFINKCFQQNKMTLESALQITREVSYTQFDNILLLKKILAQSN